MGDTILGCIACIRIQACLLIVLVARYFLLRSFILSMTTCRERARTFAKEHSRIFLKDTVLIVNFFFFHLNLHVRRTLMHVTQKRILLEKIKNPMQYIMYLKSTVVQNVSSFFFSKRIRKSLYSIK